LEGRAGLVINLRTISLLRSWVDKFPRDFQPQHIDLGVYVEAWMQQLSDTRFSKIPHAMLSSLARARSPKNTTLSYLLPTPKSIIPKVEPFALLDLDPLEIARQLSLVDFEVASRIQPKEFLRLAWTKKDKETTSPNILKRIQFTARISLFVHESLLNAVDSELQQIAELWVGVLKHLKTFASLNCVISVFGGFHSLPRAVFQKIMETLSTENQAILTDIQALCNPERHWTAARQFIREANPPCLPYFGIYLTDVRTSLRAKFYFNIQIVTYVLFCS
jgi:son of sevenless